MKNRFFICFCIALIAQYLCAQKSKNEIARDSLLTKIEEFKSSANQLAEGKTLFKLVRNTRNSQPDSSLVYAERAIDIFDALGLENEKIKIYLQQEILFRKLSKVKEYKQLTSKLENLLDGINHDSLKAKVAYGLAIGYMQTGQKKKSLEYLNNAMDVYAEIKDSISLGHSYHFKAMLSSNRDSAENFYAKELEMGRAIKDKEMIAKGLLGMGNAQARRGSLDTALTSYEEAKQMMLDLNHKEGYLILVGNMARIYDMREDYEKAIPAKKEFIELAREMGNKKEMIRGYIAIAGDNYDLKNYTEAIAHAEKAVEIGEESELVGQTTQALRFLGTYYLHVNDTIKALEHLDKTDEVCLKFNDLKVLASSYYARAEIFHSRKDFYDAEMYYKKSISTIEKSGELADLPQSTTGLVKLYLEWNEADEKEFNSNFKLSEMEQLLAKTEQVVEQTGQTKVQLRMLKLAILVNEKRGDTESLIKNQSTLIALMDTSYSQERLDASAKYIEQLNTVEKEKEIEALKYEKEISQAKASIMRNRFFGGILSLLLLATALFLYFFYKNKLKRKEETEKIRSRISSDLHDDVGSILTGLAMQSELLEMNVPDEQLKSFQNISHMSRQAMERMRDTVWAIDARKDTVDDLMDRIKDFSEEVLEGTGKKLNIKNDFSNLQENLKPDVRQSIYLIFKEALTNALKYSDSEVIDLNLSKNANTINVEIRDYGTILEDTVKTSGTGLSNMKMRAERAKGNFKHFIENGFRIQCSFPI